MKPHKKSIESVSKILNKIELYLQLLFEICPLDDQISEAGEEKSAMNSGPGE